MKSLLLIIFLSLNVGVMANEFSDTFVVEIYSQKVKVFSPKKFHTPLSVIIENKTLLSMRGKFTDLSGATIDYIRVKAGQRKSIKLNIKKDKSLFFIPVSPPFQKIELKIGKRSYEIPSQK